MKRMIKMNIRVIVTDEYIFNIGGEEGTSIQYDIYIKTYATYGIESDVLIQIFWGQWLYWYTVLESGHAAETRDLGGYYSARASAFHG